jgi:hypothetical protein
MSILCRSSTACTCRAHRAQSVEMEQAARPRTRKLYVYSLHHLPVHAHHHHHYHTHHTHMVCAHILPVHAHHHHARILIMGIHIIIMGIYSPYMHMHIVRACGAGPGGRTYALCTYVCYMYVHMLYAGPGPRTYTRRGVYPRRRCIYTEGGASIPSLCHTPLVACSVCFLHVSVPHSPCAACSVYLLTSLCHTPLWGRPRRPVPPGRPVPQEGGEGGVH